MRFDALRWAFACKVDSRAERLVLLALANDCRRADAVAFPSRERLYQMTQPGPKAIAPALRKLEQAGPCRSDRRARRQDRPDTGVPRPQRQMRSIDGMPANEGTARGAAPDQELESDRRQLRVA